MSKIEWTGRTWNFLIGCTLKSKGCENCYAMRMAYRLQHNPKMAEKYAGTAKKTAGGRILWTGKINVDHDRFMLPLQIKKPTVWFVNSMSDLFHEDVAFEWIDKAFAVMALCGDHTFQILTKRPDRMAEYFNRPNLKARIMTELDIIGDNNEKLFDKCCRVACLLPMAHEPLFKNIWLGVSVEDQKTADERIPYLLQVPAAVRFLSVEPLLGPINLKHIDADGAGHPEYCQVNALTGRHTDMARPCADVSKVDWVIVGGESGPNARPMHPDWARSLRDQCNAAGVAFFFKQWGEYYTKWFNMTTKEPAFKMYDSYLHFTQKLWVHKGDKCISIDGRDCNIGKDFMECNYPVAIMNKVGKKAAGRLLDGRIWDEMPAGRK